MAPEQTGGRPIDTRADIYALGAVLYTLIAGRPPIDTTGEPIEILRRIKEMIPAPVSRVRRDTLQKRAPSPSDTIPSEPLSGAFLHDLDLILAKSLEKDPARRYETSRHSQRTFDAPPSRTRPRAPPTLRYRTARLVQRNRGLAAAVSIIVLAASIGIGGLGFGLFEANRQKREATNQPMRSGRSTASSPMTSSRPPVRTKKDTTFPPLTCSDGRACASRHAFTGGR